MKYQIRIAFEELIRERNSGGNILLETISLLLVGIILFIGAINDYNQIVVQSALKGNLKNTGDEPTGALDSKTGDDIMKVLKSLHQMGKTIIIVTHNMEIAHQADRILKMEDGKITEY